MFLFNDANTPLHRMTPAAKVVGLVLYFAWAVAFTRPEFVVAPLMFIVVVAAVARAIPTVWHFRAFLGLLFIFSTLLWTLFVRGETLLWRCGPLRVTEEALTYGIALGLRVDAMLIAGLVFLTCTRTEEFSYGLRQLRVPYASAFAASLAFRLVPTFAAVTATIIQAQKSRGLDLESGSIPARVRKHLPLLIPVFVMALRSTDLLAMALESRGFSPRQPRTSYLHLPARWSDYVAVVLLAAMSLVSWFLRIRGVGVVKLG